MNSKMEVTDLLSQESFINFCKRSSAADIAFWENYIQEDPQRRVTVEYAKAQYVALFNELAAADLDEQLADLENSIGNNKDITAVSPAENGEGSKPALSWVYKLVAAAAVLVAVGYLVVTYSGNGRTAGAKTFLAAYGERKNIQLPDGSDVTLNSGSKIVIKADFGQVSREVYLEGEAFFDVRHQAEKPFIVHTPAMDVKALGTAFNVKAYLDEKLTETSLIRGLVEVTLIENNRSTLLLYPNQKIKWDHIPAPTDKKALPSNTPKPLPADSLTKKLVITDDGDIKEIAWKENKLMFDDQLFSEIVTSLERWYGAEIIFEDETLKDYRFTGIFEKEDLNTVLGFLKESRSFNYKIIPGEPLKVNLSK